MIQIYLTHKCLDINIKIDSDNIIRYFSEKSEIEFHLANKEKDLQLCNCCFIPNTGCCHENDNIIL
jgi:hypothetical protein